MCDFPAALSIAIYTLTGESTLRIRRGVTADVVVRLFSPHFSGVLRLTDRSEGDVFKNTTSGPSCLRLLLRFSGGAHSVLASPLVVV